MNSKSSYAVYGLVEGRWFWAIWDSEIAFWECMKTRAFGAECGIDATLINALNSIKSRMPEQSHWRRDDFFASKAYEYYWSSKQSGSTNAELIRKSTATSHIELIEQERVRRDAEVQKQIDQATKNVAELNKRIAECHSQIEHYRRTIRSLEAQHTDLLKQKSDTSWIKMLLLEKEADEIARLQVAEFGRTNSPIEPDNRKHGEV